MENLVDAVNKGAIHKYISKPMESEKFLHFVREGLKIHENNLAYRILLSRGKKNNKKLLKEAEKKDKKSKTTDNDQKSRVFVLNFNGDITASDVDCFREAVTATLQIADPKKDEIVVKLESPGGMVHSYGLAAAQLDRIKN